MNTCLILDDRVDILLPTFNGEKYLPELLDSISSQSYKNISLLIRDDASSDRTCEIISEYEFCVDNIFSVNTENIGVVENINLLLGSSSASYLMFADQDDIWLDYKVEKSLQRICEIEADVGIETPVLVFTDAFVGNERLEKQSASLLERNGYFGYEMAGTAISFKNLMVQNVVSGCTMIINRALKNLVKPIPKGAIMHDWWLILVASALGEVEYLSDRTMLYRTHSNNTIGLRAESFWKNVALVLKSPAEARQRVSKTYHQADEFYRLYSSQLNGDTKELLRRYRLLSHLGVFQRWRVLSYNKFRKNSLSKTIGFYLLS